MASKRGRRNARTGGGKISVGNGANNQRQGLVAVGRDSKRELNFDSRYGDNWKSVCARTHRATGGICCCCLKSKSEEVHHACYSDSKGAIVGREIPGFHCFPLCLDCHSRSHAPKVWIKDRTDPVLGNRNNDKWRQRLQLGYQLLATGSR